MGLFFGNKTSLGYRRSAELANTILKKRGTPSTGAAALLNMMSDGVTAAHLCGEEAEQAALYLREIAPRLSRADRADALAIAEDAKHASDSGGGWDIG
ncbi:hypothetical protein ACQP2T_61900 [Nonomuraea sp. CA-143628]|uniref:hypothetical protein n=1 Tax=Nonomuraea sp. CA-143628 TaxID=3239997 RepID=UPI003D8E7BB3